MKPDGERHRIVAKQLRRVERKRVRLLGSGVKGTDVRGKKCVQIVVKSKGTSHTFYTDVKGHLTYDQLERAKNADVLIPLLKTITQTLKVDYSVGGKAL